MFSNHHVQPRAAGRVARRELVAGQVPDRHVDHQGPIRRAPRVGSDRGGVRLQLRQRGARGGLQFDRLRLDTKLGTVSVEHVEHEEVPSGEDVAAEARTRLSEDRRHRHRLGDLGHVTRLTAPLSPKRAVSLLQVGHLFGQPALLEGSARRGARSGCDTSCGRSRSSSESPRPTAPARTRASGGRTHARDRPGARWKTSRHQAQAWRSCSR
jgi:hypothetical protein